MFWISLGSGVAPDVFGVVILYQPEKKGEILVRLDQKETRVDE